MSHVDSRLIEDVRSHLAPGTVRTRFIALCSICSVAALLLLSFFLIHRYRATTYEPYEGFDRISPALKSATFLGLDRAWIVASNSGDLWRTQDAGRHWQKTPGKAVGGSFYDASFTSRLRGWAIGSGGVVWRSDDGGNAWTKIATLEAGSPNQWTFVSSRQLYFVDNLTGWIVEPFGVWLSQDGGNSWKMVLSLSDAGITGPPVVGSFFSSKTAVIAASDGNVHRTENAGQAWQTVRLLEKGAIRHLTFLDNEVGWLVGYGPPNYDSEVHRSGDGGRVWKPSQVMNNDVSIYFIQFLSKDEGWASGTLSAPSADDKQPPVGLVMHTTTGGKTWEKVKSPTGEFFFEEVHFIDQKHGWLLGRNSVYRTDDGGATWAHVLRVE